MKYSHIARRDNHRLLLHNYFLISAQQKETSSVYTQMSSKVPNVEDANNYLLAFISSRGGQNLKIIDTKIYKFFTNYMDRDLSNGILYEILKLQGKHRMWYIGKSVYLDNINSMIGYNKMIVDAVQI